jgi:acyl-CoA synthetase (AMP-forming)/AMP-acid ligase II
MDDMIITGGENVYSIEVENVLNDHPKVLEAAVIGIDDEEWGERIVAVIVPRGEEPTENELTNHCKKELASFKVPKQFIQTDEIPMTTSGKIKKNLLRKKYGEID